jgi:hypothetical protein
VALREQFTPEEWQQVTAGPVNAGMLVAVAQMQGPIGLAQEMKAIYDVTVTGVINSPSELLREIGAYLAQQQGKPEQSEADKARSQQAMDQAKNDPQAFFLGEISKAVALVAAKVPGDVETYKSWLLECAQKTAQAAKEGGFFGFGGVQVTPQETATIERLSAALAAPVAAPATAPAEVPAAGASAAATATTGTTGATGATGTAGAAPEAAPEASGPATSSTAGTTPGTAPQAGTGTTGSTGSSGTG